MPTDKAPFSLPSEGFPLVLKKNNLQRIGPDQIVGVKLESRHPRPTFESGPSYESIVGQAIFVRRQRSLGVLLHHFVFSVMSILTLERRVRETDALSLPRLIPGETKRTMYAYPERELPLYRL